MPRLLPVALVLLAGPASARAQAPAAPPASVAAEPAPASSASPAAMLGDALRLQQQGDFAGAAAGYERILALGVENPAVRSNLGAAYAALGRYDDAIDQYRR